MMRRTLQSLVFAMGLYLSTDIAFATTVFESEDPGSPNNTFATANVFGPDTTLIEGFRGQFEVDGFFLGDLLPGSVDFPDFFGLTPGEEFFVFIDNTPEAFFGIPDTLLRSLDEFFFEIDFDDDSSPLGDGFASALSGTVNSDGSILLDVSGFPDFDFIGDHGEFGAYNLYLQLGTSTFVGDATPDIDFFTIEGLTPGTTVTITVEDAMFDSVLGIFDETGLLIDDDDDGGVDLLSSIDAVVNADGTVNFAISGFSDFDFDGGSDAFGSGFYSISIFVPEPSTVMMLASGLVLVFGAAIKRRRV